MKKLLLVLLLLAAGIIGVGFYRGWFTVNQQTLERDEISARNAIHGLEEKVKQKTVDRKTPARDRK